MSKFKVLFGAFLLVLLSACEMKAPTEVYEVELKSSDGETVKFLCPVIDSNRTRTIYKLDRYCVVIRE